MTSHEPLARNALQEQYGRQLEMVNAGVGTFAEALRAQTGVEHPDVGASVDSYLSVLEAGGKRTRGLLTVAGYEMCGGEDQGMIAQAAGAIEAVHASLLVVDDVLDASDLRRGAPAAHRRMEGYLRDQGRAGDLPRLAEGTVELAALLARDEAQQVVLGLQVPPERILLAVQQLNKWVGQTGVGQILDVLSPTRDDISESDIARINTSKTAYYSFLMPLQVGAALAGAPPEELELFTPYALHAGSAFQLQDDIIGLFGDEATTGKPRMSDMLEGKRTMLMLRTLELADVQGDTTGKQAILAALGNPDLQEEHFDYCLDVIRRTGALQVIGADVDWHTQQALATLDQLPTHWDQQHIQPLRDLAAYGAQRRV